MWMWRCSVCLLFRQGRVLTCTKAITIDEFPSIILCERHPHNTTRGLWVSDVVSPQIGMACLFSTCVVMATSVFADSGDA